jgi:hypothetical protein
MKKLLFQFDTDHYPSVFDTVVAYDGGADHVIGHAKLNPDNVRALVEGAILRQAIPAFSICRDTMVTSAPSSASMTAARCPTGPVPARITAFFPLKEPLLAN